MRLLSEAYIGNAFRKRTSSDATWWPGQVIDLFNSLPPAVMSHSVPDARIEMEQARWNRAYRDPVWRRTRFNARPNELLVETVRLLLPGRALDVHMGEGRNALHLAALGWQVTGVDVAEQGLAYAHEQAQERGLSLTTHAQDSRRYAWGAVCWDLLVLCYADEDDHVAPAARALQPGGRVMFENFHADVNAARGTPRISGSASPAANCRPATRPPVLTSCSTRSRWPWPIFPSKPSAWFDWSPADGSVDMLTDPPHRRAAWREASCARSLSPWRKLVSVAA